MRSWHAPSISAVVSLALGCGGAPSGAATECRSAMHGMHHEGHEGHEGHGGHDGEPTAAVHDHDHDHAHHVESMQHDFSDVAAFEAMFDAPERSAWQHPVDVVTMLEITPGQTVVDLGTGTGYFLPFLSLVVGPHGQVLALDSEPAMVAHVAERALREGLGNVRSRTVDPGDPELPAESVDHILIVDTWHHLTDRARYAVRLHDALRPGGSVLVVDFTPDTTRGPPVADRVSPEAVALELTDAGLTVEVLAESLPDQYVVRGRRSAP